MELVRFRGRERRINIPQEVSTKYTQFGILLLENTYGDRVRNMEHKHRGDAEQINMEILREWVSGRGKQPVSWETLTEVLRDVELSVLASEIEAVKRPSDSEHSDFDFSGRDTQPVSRETSTEVSRDMDLGVLGSEIETVKLPSDSELSLSTGDKQLVSRETLREVLRDVELCVLADDKEAVKLTSDTELSDFDFSVRGKQPVSWETLVEILRDVGELGLLASEIETVKVPTDSDLSDSECLAPSDFEFTDSDT